MTEGEPIGTCGPVATREPVGPDRSGAERSGNGGRTQ